MITIVPTPSMYRVREYRNHWADTMYDVYEQTDLVLDSSCEGYEAAWPLYAKHTQYGLSQEECAQLNSGGA